MVGYDDKGLPKTKNVLAKTKRECQEKLTKLLETVGGPKSEKIRPDMPFGEWLDFWYQTYVKPGLRPTTQANYEANIYQHIIPQLGKIPLNQLTQKDLQQFYAQLKKEGRLIRTEQYRQGPLRPHGADVPRQMPGRSGAGGAGEPDPHQPGGGLQAAAQAGPGDAGAVAARSSSGSSSRPRRRDTSSCSCWTLSTGLRRGELLALQWSDLDLDTGTLSVTKQVYEVKGQLQVSVPKDQGVHPQAGPAARRGGGAPGVSGDSGTPGGCSPPRSRRTCP